MDNNLNNVAVADTRENVVAGIVGAFLFGLAGGVLWFVIYMFGFIAGISGLVGAVCAIKGYSVFAKKESIKGIIISVVIAVLILVVAWYACIAYDVCQAYKSWFENGEIDYTLTYFESVRAVPYFLGESEIGLAYLGDLGIGLLFCIVGGGSYVVNKLKAAKQSKAVANAPEVQPAEPEITPVNEAETENKVNEDQ